MLYYLMVIDTCSKYRYNFIMYLFLCRNTESYKRIMHYIIDNPMKWEEDPFCQ